MPITLPLLVAIIIAIPLGAIDGALGYQSDERRIFKYAMLVVFAAVGFFVYDPSVTLPENAFRLACTAAAWVIPEMIAGRIRRRQKKNNSSEVSE